MDSPLPAFVSWAITLIYVVLLFVLFRAADFETASRMFERLMGRGGWGELWPWATLIPIAIAGTFALIKVPSYEFAMRMQPTWQAACVLVVVAVFCVLEVGAGQPLSFIYFQF